MKSNRFKLEKSNETPGWYVLTDMDNLVVIRFKEHEYNETQKVSLLDESELIKDSDCANSARKLACIMKEMGEYIATRYYSIAMPVPTFELRQDDDTDRLLIVRHKSPRFTIEIQEDTDTDTLASAVSKAAEFLRKRALRNNHADKRGGKHDR